MRSEEQIKEMLDKTREKMDWLDKQDFLLNYTERYDRADAVMEALMWVLGMSDILEIDKEE